MENETRSAEDLYSDLWAGIEQAKDALSGDDLVGALVAYARAAARGTSARDRAGALVSLGATLRKAGRWSEAIDVLREARSLTDDVKVQVAAMTCEVAIRCDQGEDEEARRIGESARELASTPFLLKALGRAWMDGFRATGILEFRDRALQCFELAEAGVAEPA